MENGHEPATKADLAQLGDALRSDTAQLADQLRSEMTQLRDQLRSESQHGFDDLKETLRDVQTEMLKAFYGFAQSTDARFKETEMADMMLRGRLTAVEFRLTEIEKRINLPPQ
jgi:hypothetical protein